ncbi:DUF3147 family protein [Actinomadura sp. HBU206391]|uniref:DUF3147 family protein n=1 Tax=Actinomadura sp. HBU206391 TaxID=2731692 RepID=UPI00164FDD59|nr:DUF3147 family protein [Actinomadura sp. HBU206391]MBC6463106.1 DUF3147 family protein [Actinomadura sp. HBU206391]
MVEILLKALCGGIFVLAFALISEMVMPKRFAGIFSAAPSVALGSLAVSLVTKGAHEVEAAAVGMSAGANALLAYSAAAVPALRRFGALRGAGIAIFAWFLVGGAGAWVLL